jgi:TonB family protein
MRPAGVCRRSVTAPHRTAPRRKAKVYACIDASIRGDAKWLCKVSGMSINQLRLRRRGRAPLNLVDGASLDQLRLMPILFALACLAAPAGSRSSSAPLEPDSGIAARAVEGRRQETWANCRVLVWVRASGRVQIAQVMNPSGSALLDEACLNLAIGQTVHIEAGPDAAKDRWKVLPIKWVELGVWHRQSPQSAYQTVPVPLIAPDQRLEVEPLSSDPRLPHKEGVCAMHVLVSTAGEAQQLKLTRSTGNTALDEACIKVLQGAHFTPARRDDQDVVGMTNIWIRCVLPD